MHKTLSYFLRLSLLRVLDKGIYEGFGGGGGEEEKGGERGTGAPQKRRLPANS